MLASPLQQAWDRKASLRDRENVSLITRAPYRNDQLSSTGPNARIDHIVQTVVRLRHPPSSVVVLSAFSSRCQHDVRVRRSEIRISFRALFREDSCVSHVLL
jgi:hypothetical protein